jgi:hypothetical protein
MYRVTEEEEEKFFKEADQLSDEIADFLMGKGISAAMAIFACMTTMGGLAVLQNIPRDVFVRLASDTMDRMLKCKDNMDKEAE